MALNKALIAVPIIAVAIIVSIAMSYSADPGSDMQDPVSPAQDPVSPAQDPGSQAQEAPALSGDVNLGVLLPLTGDLASHGEEDRMAALLAVDDFNAYLRDNGRDWQFTSTVEDTQTNPVIALEKVTALNAKGINVVVGPATSANIRNIIGYATANNVILISCCSTAPALAIAGDNVFRTVPDDTKQGPAIADLMKSRGVEALIPVWRADAWGDGLRDATVEAFSSSGGVVDDGIRYNPESPEFSASTSLLANQVQQYVDQYGADKVGVLLISFSETLQFMQSASAHDVLDDVRWFGSDANTNEQKIIEDPIGLQFSQAVDFTTVQFAAFDNPVNKRVKDHIVSELGRVPSVYAYTSYDAVWLAGLAIDAAQSTETAQIRENIIPVAADFTGAVGSTKLNPAGDLDSSDYAVWTISDDVWIVIDQ